MFASASASETCFFCPFDSLPKRLFSGTPNVRSRVLDARPGPTCDTGAQQNRAIAATLISGGASASSVTTPTRCMSSGTARPDVFAEQRDRPVVGFLLAEETADERRLAGAVAADERVDRAARHVQRHVIDCDLAAVAHGEIGNLDRSVAHAFLLCSRTTRS